MIWNISGNTTFQCYGSGCLNLGDVYDSGNDTEFTDVTFGIDACAQCTSIRECMGTWNLHCNAGSDSFTPADGCDNQNQCGCQDIIMNNTNYDVSYSDKDCYSIVTVQTCLPDRPCVLYCDSNTCQQNVLDGRGANSLTVLCTTAVCFSLYIFYGNITLTDNNNKKSSVFLSRRVYSLSYWRYVSIIPSIPFRMVKQSLMFIEYPGCNVLCTNSYAVCCIVPILCGDTI